LNRAINVASVAEPCGPLNQKAGTVSGLSSRVFPRLQIRLV
jgi:hypothetical protein